MLNKKLNILRYPIRNILFQKNEELQQKFWFIFIFMFYIFHLCHFNLINIFKKKTIFPILSI